MSTSSVVVVGGGVAAVRCVQALRRHGHTGRITLLTEELEHPYDRPPLSKDMLSSDEARGPSYLLPPDVAENLSVDVRLDHQVESIDPDRRTVAVAGRDEPVPYDSLVIATGTRARTLPALNGFAGVHHLRTAADARTIREHVCTGSALTVVGAGFIGLEVASTARDLGCDVTVIEVAERPLGHVFGDRIATWLQEWHAARGVEFHCGVSVDHARSEDGGLVITLDDGTEVLSQAVLVGVGVYRDVGWLADSGIETHVGLVCDAGGRTSRPGIFGAGDIVCVHDDSGCSPGQHWTAASESGERVARSVLGIEEEESLEEHYFWSDQAGLRLMSVGRRTPRSELEITSADLDRGQFVAQWTEDGRVVAVLGSNSAKEFLRGRLAFRDGLTNITPVRT